MVAPRANAGVVTAVVTSTQQHAWPHTRRIKITHRHTNPEESREETEEEEENDDEFLATVMVVREMRPAPAYKWNHQQRKLFQDIPEDVRTLESKQTGDGVNPKKRHD